MNKKHIKTIKKTLKKIIYTYNRKYLLKSNVLKIYFYIKKIKQ